MNGQKIGYIRVSSFEQNPTRQLEGQKLDIIFTDFASGKNTQRPELKNLLKYARQGDTVVVHSLDRLARNLADLRQMVDELTARGVHLKFIKENLVFTGDDSPMARLLLSMMGAFAEFERSLIRERQREGIELAKKRGAYKGRKKALTKIRSAELKKRAAGGERKSDLAREFKISRETVYKYLRSTDA